MKKILSKIWQGVKKAWVKVNTWKWKVIVDGGMLFIGIASFIAYLAGENTGAVALILVLYVIANLLNKSLLLGDLTTLRTENEELKQTIKQQKKRIYSKKSK